MYSPPSAPLGFLSTMPGYSARDRYDPKFKLPKMPNKGPDGEGRRVQKMKVIEKDKDKDHEVKLPELKKILVDEEDTGFDALSRSLGKVIGELLDDKLEDRWYHVSRHLETMPHGHVVMPGGDNLAGALGTLLDPRPEALLTFIDVSFYHLLQSYPDLESLFNTARSTLLRALHYHIAPPPLREVRDSVQDRVMLYKDAKAKVLRARSMSVGGDVGLCSPRSVVSIGVGRAIDRWQRICLKSTFAAWKTVVGESVKRKAVEGTNASITVRMQEAEKEVAELSNSEERWTMVWKLEQATAEVNLLQTELRSQQQDFAEMRKKHETHITKLQAKVKWLSAIVDQLMPAAEECRAFSPEHICELQATMHEGGEMPLHVAFDHLYPDDAEHGVTSHLQRLLDINTIDVDVLDDDVVKNLAQLVAKVEAHATPTVPRPSDGEVQDPVKVMQATIAGLRKQLGSISTYCKGALRDAVRSCIAAREEQLAASLKEAEMTRDNPLLLEAIQNAEVCPEDRSGVYDCLQRNEKRLLGVYQYYASTDKTVDIVMSRNEWEKFLRDVKPDTRRKSRVSVPDVQRNTAKDKDKDKSGKEWYLPAAYLEQLVRHAVSLPKGQGVVAKTEQFVETIKMSNIMYVCCDEFMKNLNGDATQAVLKQAKQVLSLLFNKYALDKGKGVTFKEFKKLADDAHVVDEICTHYAIQQLFLKMQSGTTLLVPLGEPCADLPTFTMLVCGIAVYKNPAPYVPFDIKVKHFLAAWLAPLADLSTVRGRRKSDVGI
eukprot:TRINITY_DN11129_c0_g1_i1.p1 TRINITY_DN11129_c0_g1~~TRINITY_DN11129_c0_g1_i1.p1  ORF type:complete len:771 (+),score=205.36 TRINITY_DN11129_c0_g1_i1:352-2664(+)